MEIEMAPLFLFIAKFFMLKSKKSFEIYIRGILNTSSTFL